MTQTLGALSFTTPLMLWGMAAVSLPLVAHLMNRRIRRQIIFPTLKLLRESVASQSRLFRLRRWILLALRCLAVLLLAWVFSRPVWTASSQASGGLDRSASVVLILDTSASSAQQTDGVELIHSMRAVAGRLLDALQDGRDRVNIVYATASPRAAYPQLTSSFSALRSELSRLAPTFDRADLPAALHLAGDMLRDQAGHSRVVILSDMQRTNWSEVTLGGDGPGPEPVEGLPEGTVVTVLPVEGGGAANVALVDPRAFPTRAIVGQPLQLLVQVVNYAGRRQEVEVDVTVDGRPLGAQKMTLIPWEGRDVAFQTTLDSPGAHRVVFYTRSDSLAADNHSFLVVQAASRIPLVVVGDDDPNEPGTATYFLLRALAPRGDQGDTLDVRHLAGADLTYARLQDAEAVLVSYVAKLGPESLQALYMYANHGGGVAFFCGDGPVAANLQGLAALADKDDFLPWVPVSQRDLAADGQFLQITGGLWGQAPLADFDEESRAALAQVHFGRVWSGSTLRPRAITLLKFSDDTPAVSRQRAGAGQFILCNFSPALASSDLGKYGSFVALVHSITHALRPEKDWRSQAIAGQPFRYTVTVTSAGTAAGERAELRLLGPDERACQADMTGDNTYIQVSMDRAALPGFYRLMLGAREVAAAAVNVDPRESDLRTIDAALLREHLRQDGVAVEIRGLEDQGPVLRVRGLPLWPHLLAAAMVVLGLELGLLALWKR